MSRTGITLVAFAAALSAAELASAHHLEPRATTDNTRAVAHALDHAMLTPGDPLFETEAVLDDDALLSPAEFETGLRSLSGEVIPGLLASRLLVSRQFDRMLARQLRPVGPERPGEVHGGLGTSGGFLPHDPYGSGSGCEAGPYYVPPPPSSWGRVSGLDSDGETGPYGPPGNDVNSVLFQLGYTFPVDVDLLFGAALAYATTDTDGDLELGEFDSETVRVSFYTRKEFGPAYLTAATSYGYDQTRLTRQFVAGPLFVPLTTDKFDGHEFATFVEYGATFSPKWGVTLQPLVGLRYARVFRDASRELTVDSVALSFDAQDEDALEFRLGGRMAKSYFATRAVELIPEVRGWWLHDFQAEVPVTTVTLAGLPDRPFAVSGQRPDENLGVVGLGVTAVLDNEYALWFQYDGEYGERTTTHVATAGFLSVW